MAPREITLHAQIPTRRHAWLKDTLHSSDDDPGVAEHGLSDELMDLAATYDQLRVTELASMEAIGRRFQLWEEHYRGQHAGAGSTNVSTHVDE